MKIHTDHSDTRSLKTKMREKAKAMNGTVVYTAVHAAAKFAGRSDQEAQTLASKAAMDSLIRPVIVSSYDDLSEDLIDTLAGGDTRGIVTAGSRPGLPFDPWATKTNFRLLLPSLTPIALTAVVGTEATMAAAVGCLLAALYAAWPSIQTTITGVDAELILVFIMTPKPADNLDMLKTALFSEVNLHRAQRGDALLSQTAFDASIARLIQKAFFVEAPPFVAVALA